MNAIHPPPGLKRVLDLYASLRADVASLPECPPAEPALCAEAAAFLAYEARLLDGRAFQPWLDLWDEDGLFWAPLTVDGDPANDQALFLDDHRRIRERIWRMGDTSAWALHPAAVTLRLVGSVEAWPLPGGEILASSAIALQHTRLQAQFSTIGRQIHRLRRGPAGWRLHRKILLLPEQTIGTPHLGWLL